MSGLNSSKLGPTRNILQRGDAIYVKSNGSCVWGMIVNVRGQEIPWDSVIMREMHSREDKLIKTKTINKHIPREQVRRYWRYI
jgi:hypothetical protein